MVREVPPAQPARWPTSTGGSSASSASRTSSAGWRGASRPMDLRHRVRAHWKRLAWLFAILGPGVITSNVDNDAGGIYTYSLAGARYGYTPPLGARPGHGRARRRPGDVLAHGHGHRQGPGRPHPRALRPADDLPHHDGRPRHQLRQHRGRVRRARLEPRALRGEPRTSRSRSARSSCGGWSSSATTSRWRRSSSSPASSTWPTRSRASSPTPTGEVALEGSFIPRMPFDLPAVSMVVGIVGHHHRPLDAVLPAVLGGREGEQDLRLPRGRAWT